VQAVSALASVSPPPGGETGWLSIFVGGDGAVERGPQLRSGRPFTGEIRKVELLDAAGTVIDIVDGVFLPRADTDSGLVAFREPPQGVTAARIPGHPAVELR
jgi:hypothetical protein